MKKEEVRARIEKTGIVPAVRVSDAELAMFAAETLNDAGIQIAEITMTVPGAVEVIARLADKYPDFVAGAGTVLDVETAKRCLDAGACFLTGPGLVMEVVEFALKNDVVVIPGALTPSEIIAAWKGGADFVKVFPCAPVGGHKYIRALKVPLGANTLDRLRRCRSGDGAQIYPRWRFCPGDWGGTFASGGAPITRGDLDP